MLGEGFGEKRGENASFTLLDIFVAYKTCSSEFLLT